MKKTFLILTLVLAAGCAEHVGRTPGDNPDDPYSLGDGGTFVCSEEAANYIYTLDVNQTLSRFDPKQYTFQDVGTLSCPAQPGATPFSMAIDHFATAWVIYTSGELFQVSTQNGASCTATPDFMPGQGGLTIFGMGFVADNNRADRETLYVAGGQPNVDRTQTSIFGNIDLPKRTVTTVGKVSGWPELTGTGDGKLMGFFPSSTMPHLSEINRTSGRESNPLDLPTLVGKPDAWAFAFWGGDYFVFLKRAMDTGTNVYKIVVKAGGQAIAVKGSTRKIVGAGVSVCAPTVIK